MSNDQTHTTDETEPTRATRRTVLRGAGVAGLLTMGVGTASAQRGRSEQARQQEQQARQQAQQQSAGRGGPRGGPTLPDQASQIAKDRIDIIFPGRGGETPPPDNDIDM